MKWQAKPEKEKPYPFQWHSWFAWYPVQVDNEWVWLEYIERRYKEDGPISFLVFYRTKSCR